MIYHWLPATGWSERAVYGDARLIYQNLFFAFITWREDNSSGYKLQGFVQKVQPLPATQASFLLQGCEEKSLSSQRVQKLSF